MATPTRTTILNRFRKAVTFWRTLTPEQFDYSNWVSKKDEETQCGTVCCLGGWMPRVSPRVWYWNPGPHKLRLEYRGREWDGTDNQLATYFGFDERLVRYVFYGKSGVFLLEPDVADFIDKNMPALTSAEDSPLDEVMARVEWVLAELEKPESLIWKLTLRPTA
jgi:hypothetical protein